MIQTEERSTVVDEDFVWLFGYKLFTAAVIKKGILANIKDTFDKVRRFIFHLLVFLGLNSGVLFDSLMLLTLHFELLEHTI